MKLNKKTLIISIIVIFLITFIVLLASIKNRKITKPSYDHTAIIYHSEILGVDAGIIYKYYLYQENKNTYIYIKTVSDIT